MEVQGKGARSTEDNLLVLSLDYDGCCYVLDDSNAVSGITHMLLPYLNSIRHYMINGAIDNNKAQIMNQNIETFVKFASEKIKGKLEGYLSAYSDSSDGVSLYVGSNRQSVSLDNFNTQKNKNGSCFTALSKYSQEKDWEFNGFLLADVVDEKFKLRNPRLESGTAIKNRRYDCEFDELKVRIIKHQLEDVIRNHGSEKKIKFVFIDDDIKNTIIKALQEHFVLNPDELPSNIELTLVKFDWYKAINQSMLWNYLCGKPGNDIVTLIEDLSVSLDKSFDENKKVLNAKAEGVNTAMPAVAPSVEMAKEEAPEEKSEKDPGEDSSFDSSGGGCGGSASPSAFVFGSNQIPVGSGKRKVSSDKRKSSELSC